MKPTTSSTLELERHSSALAAGNEVTELLASTEVDIT